MSQDKLVYEILQPILQDMEERLIEEFQQSFVRIKVTVSKTRIVIQKLISQAAAAEMTKEFNKMEGKLDETVKLYEKRIVAICKRIKRAAFAERRKHISSKSKPRTASDYSKLFR